MGSEKITRRSAITTTAMAMAAPLLDLPLLFAQAQQPSEEMQRSINALEQIIDEHAKSHKEQEIIDEAVDRALGKDSFKYVKRFVYDPGGSLAKQVYNATYEHSLKGNSLQKFEGASAITLPIQTESGIKSYVFFKESALPRSLNDKNEREAAYHEFLGKIAHENAHASIYGGRLKVQGESASSLLKVDREIADFLQEVQCNNEELMFLTRYWIRQEAFMSAINTFTRYIRSESERILARTDITESDRKMLERQKTVAISYIDTAIRIRNSYRLQG